MSEEEWWTPNAITYGVVMHGLRGEGKLSEACDFVREMIRKGFFPTPVEINLLIQSLCQEGRMDEAKKFMQECLSKGCAVNAVNFPTLIHGYSQKDDLDPLTENNGGGDRDRERKVERVRYNTFFGFRDRYKI